jgi:hypothetical protein
MRKIRFSFRMLAVALLAITACSEDTPVGDPNLGSVDPTMYVAIGNSLTAGYQSGALFEEAQLYSFPNLLARAIAAPDFQQPLMPYPGTGELRILQTLVPSAVIRSNGLSQRIPTNATLARPFNNLGLPGALAYDAVDESPILERAQQRSNPFYMFIMRDQNTFGKSLVDQAIALQPTVLTFWLGSNDILWYAASGGTFGTNVGLVDPPRTMPTERAIFQQAIQAAFGRIKTALPNTKVLVANLPHPLIAPYFNTVPRGVPNPANPAQMLNIYYKNKEGNVGVVGEFDYVLLTAQSELQKGIGLTPGNPLASQYVLDNAEASVVLQAVADFNNILLTETELSGFTLVDMYSRFLDFHENGYFVAGEKYSTAFISGGMFSLDGLHLSSRGNALVANAFIESMNKAFNANIRYVPLHTIPGMKSPEAASVGKRGVPWSLDMQFPAGNLSGIYRVE